MWESGREVNAVVYTHFSKIASKLHTNEIDPHVPCIKRRIQCIPYTYIYLMYKKRRTFINDIRDVTPWDCCTISVSAPECHP